MFLSALFRTDQDNYTMKWLGWKMKKNPSNTPPLNERERVSEEPHFDGELELLVELGYEHVVTECLPHLHDADDGGVDLVLPVLEYLLRRTRVLLRLQMTCITMVTGCRHGYEASPRLRGAATIMRSHPGYRVSPRLRGVATVTRRRHGYGVSPRLQNISSFSIHHLNHISITKHHFNYNTSPQLQHITSITTCHFNYNTSPQLQHIISITTHHLNYNTSPQLQHIISIIITPHHHLNYISWPQLQHIIPVYNLSLH